jgi:hypothetical protein
MRKAKRAATAKAPPPSSGIDTQNFRVVGSACDEH